MNLCLTTFSMRELQFLIFGGVNNMNSIFLVSKKEVTRYSLDEYFYLICYVAFMILNIPNVQDSIYKNTPTSSDLSGSMWYTDSPSSMKPLEEKV